MSYRGQVLAPAARARYLGLFYGPPAGQGHARQSLFTNSWVELLAVGKRAAFSMSAKLSARGVHLPSAVMSFYNLCVRSTFSFGAQVWSTPFLTADFDSAMKHDMVGEQRQFMQRLVGAQRPSNRLLYMELSQLPLQHHWAGLVLRFWNSLAGKPGQLCHSAFRSDIRMALESGVGWAHDVIAFLRSLEFDSLPDHALSTLELVDAYSSLQLPVDSLLSAMAKGLCSAWHTADVQHADPREYVGEAGLSVCRYMNWMGLPDCAARADGRPAPLRHAGLAMARERHLCLMRFRLCTWDLAANRSYGRSRSRAERVCLACVSAGRGHPVEDEKHVLLECPEFEDLRAAFAHVLPLSSGDMLSVLNTNHQKDLADYVTQLRDRFELVHNSYVDSMACAVCNGQDNAQNMLLCDGVCSRGFHMRCHDPPVAAKPRQWEPWFCHDCSAARNMFDV